MFTVLIVDDEQDVCGLMRRVFERAGWGAVCVSDSTLALGTLRAVRVDVVLMELMILGVEGLSLLRQFRASADAGRTSRPRASALRRPWRSPRCAC